MAPNSPDLMPIENVWALVQEKLNSYAPATSESALVKQLKTAWSEISPETLENLYLGMSNRIKTCIRKKGGHIVPIAFVSSWTMLNLEEAINFWTHCLYRSIVEVVQTSLQQAKLSTRRFQSSAKANDHRDETDNGAIDTRPSYVWFRLFSVEPIWEWRPLAVIEKQSPFFLFVTFL